MSATARLSGVGTPTRLPSSTTAPLSHGTSSRLPRARSPCIDAVICGGNVSTNRHPLLGEIVGQPHAERPADRDNLARDVAQEGPGLRIGADRADAGAHAGGAGRHGDQEGEFLPGRQVDVVGDLGVDARRGAGRQQRLDARRSACCPVHRRSASPSCPCARSRRDWRSPRRSDRRRRSPPRGPRMRVSTCVLADAVLERHHGGAWSHQAASPLRPRSRCPTASPRSSPHPPVPASRDRLSPPRRADADRRARCSRAVRSADRREMCSARDEGDVVARCRQPCAEIAAEAAGPHDDYTHALRSADRMRIVNAQMPPTCCDRRGGGPAAFRRPRRTVRR